MYWYLEIKLHSKPVYDEKYIKTKVKTFNGVVKKSSSHNKIQKKNPLLLYSSNKYRFCHENR